MPRRFWATASDVLEMAKGNWKAKRGSFLKFSWSTVGDLTGATRNETETVLWQELLGLANTMNVELNAAGYNPPACYPGRDDLDRSDSNPVVEGPPMGLIAQVERTQWGAQTTVNSPICGWVKAPPYASVAP
ncbi:MAG: hypothetical protein L6Q84_13670 [Polyangiaceae bacterium]|nr:hypothetical protein [Polyangiaceae bacterium]